MILFSISGWIKALFRLWKERKNIKKFGEWGWTLAQDLYRDVEGEAARVREDPSKRNWTREQKALVFDAKYLDAYEKAAKKSIPEEKIFEIREEAWKFFNEGRERRPAPVSKKTKLRRVGKARRR